MDFLLPGGCFFICEPQLCITYYGIGFHPFGVWFWKLNHKSNKTGMIMSINNYLRNPEFESDFAGYLDHTPLSYPMIPLQVGEDVCMVYEIPENEMQKILNKVNPYQKRNAEDLMFDELMGECFKWKQAIVLWYRNTNLLVSPFFVKSGADIHWIRKWHPGIQKSKIPLICK